MPPLDKLKGAFAFSHAALADEENPDAVHVDERAVDRYGGCKGLVQEVDERAGEPGRILPGHEYGDSLSVRKLNEEPVGLLIVGEDAAEHIVRKKFIERFFFVFIGELAQVRAFPEAEYLYPVEGEKIVKPCKGEAGPVDVADPYFLIKT